MHYFQVASWAAVLFQLVTSVECATVPLKLTNGLQAKNCSDVYVYYARGTLEDPPIGTTLGPPFQEAMKDAMDTCGKSLTFAGIDYSNTWDEYVSGGDPAGGAAMANNVTSTALSCPKAKIIMSGYSQGAQLVHIAADQLATYVQFHVHAVVTFGDPDRDSLLPSILQNRRDTYCNEGDVVCDGVHEILPPHLQYESHIPDAVAFIEARINCRSE